MYAGLHGIFCRIFIKLEFSGEIFEKYTFSWKSF